MGLGIQGDAHGLVVIGPIVQIDVADAIEVFDDRHPGLGTDPLNQPLAATGHDDIHVFRHGDQCPHRGAVHRVHHLYGVFWQFGNRQPLLDAAGNGPVGVNGLTATAQNHGIAGFQAEAGRLHSDVGARFVDDADDAQRHTHFTHLDTTGDVFKIINGTDRVGQGSDLTQPLNHGVDPGISQFQAVKHGGIQPSLLTSSQVLAVGLLQFGTLSLKRLGDGQQCLVFQRSIGHGHGLACLPGFLAQAVHILRYLLSHCFSPGYSHQKQPWYQSAIGMVNSNIAPPCGLRWKVSLPPWD